MTAPRLSTFRPRLRLVSALAISALLHGAAIAVASLNRPAPATDFNTPWESPPEVSLEPYEEPSQPTPPVELADLPPPPVPDHPPMFSDVAPPLTPPQASKSLPIPKRHSHPSASRGAPSARALALHAPIPEYPYEARRARTTGDGLAILTIDSSTGRVLEVKMAQSTGSAVLDNAACAGLRRWRFRPGSPAQIRCPITYTLAGAIF